VVVDKPAGVTSHDVVGMLRRRLQERRVGHAGTLDPDATGVLLVGVGNATRLLRFLTALGKSYTATVVLGTETSTLDAAGEVTAVHDMSGVTLDAVRRVAAEHLTGTIMQVPPMVSALKVDGKRLHELAREGIEVEREARPVTVSRFEVEPTDDPLRYRIDVTVSSGTYVRSLAADLGRLLGGGAHLTDLRRTSCGSFTVDEARSPDEAPLLSVREAMRDLATIEIAEADLFGVRNGRTLPAPDGPGPWVVVHGDEVVAVHERHGTQARPAVVIPVTPSDAR
jgi:tRNA pseudouridine55 synthase